MKFFTKLRKSSKMRKFRRRIFSRYLIISLFFAGTLWIYSTLNIEFVTFVKVPLIIKLPANRAVENPLPAKLSVEFRGTGWNLLNLVFFNSSSVCLVDFSREVIKGYEINITQDDFIKNLQDIGNVHAISVFPRKMTLELGHVGEYAIQVIPDVKIIPREGFIQVGKIEFKPDMINIRGYDDIVQKILSWKTEPTVIKDVFQPLVSTVPLLDTLSGIVEHSQKTIKVIADIQLEAEQTCHDLKIKIIGGNISDEHIIKPDKITITLRGGIKRLENLKPENISVVLHADKIMKDIDGILIPEIEIPEDLQIVNIYPSYIYHFKRNQFLKLTYK